MRKLSSKETALIICFAALYAATSHIPLFPVIGAESKSISAGAIMSLVVGLVLGAFLGGLATIIGGLVSMAVNLEQGALGPFSPIPHIAAALCAGALKDKRQMACAAAYILIFIFFGFFPFIGPVWIWPQMLWLHVVSMIIMASPIQSKAIQSISEGDSAKLTFGVAVTLFTSTLFSQLVGSTIFELINLGNTDSAYWQGVWQWVTPIYPLERIMITAATTIIAVPTLKALRKHGFRV